MPKTKKRGKGNRSDKEKPLITVQGVLRLEKSFCTAQHADADFIEVQKEEKKEKILLIPGQSEHELVEYKAGYDIGPSNPFPVNEPEEIIYQNRLKIQEKEAAFESLKEESLKEKEARNKKFKEEVIKNTGYDPSESGDYDADDPRNYHLPEHPGFNDIPLQFKDSSSSQELVPPGEESSTQEKIEEPPQSVSQMALSVAIEMETKRKESSPEITKSIEKEDDGIICSLKELENSNARLEEEKNLKAGPEISHDQLTESQKSQEDYNAKLTLERYWAFVKSNPNDFNGWTYLIAQTESVDLIEEIRKAYNAFLPLYPYCYAYWLRYSGLEKKHEYWQRSLAILYRGLEAIPLSVDLWIAYLELYHQLYNGNENFDELFSAQCERAVATVGLEYKSDPLWDRYIEWEKERNNSKRVTKIYRRLISVPTKLYNKHWDNFIAFIRDHHPRDILEYEEYEELRKLTCKELDLTYRPDPVIEPTEVRPVVAPEDKLKAGMKERIVAAIISDHEKTETTVDEISRFEEKIKRPYFHVKGLDVKQIKNWDAYLDYEISIGNHERIVILFERCLIPCANYEQFWAKYARYLELHLKKIKTSGNDSHLLNISGGVSALDLEKARWSFGTGLKSVDELKTKRCAWTLRGWKDTDDDGQEVMKAEPIGDSSDKIPSPVKCPTKKEEENSSQKEINEEMTSVLKTSWTQDSNVEAIRAVYIRACMVHCPTKAMIKLKWAAFEEESENVDRAKNILNGILEKYPLLIEACIQYIDIERRSGNSEKVEELYKKLIKKIPENRKTIRTWISMKYARYLFKVVGNSDKALSVLRSSVKKQRGDVRLYAQIIDVCYQRRPVDVPGVTAAIELALVSPELTARQKFEFIKRKVEFMQEFGDIRRYRDALDQMKDLRFKCAIELKAEAKKKKELEKEEMKLNELTELKAHTKAIANMKAKIAESEGRLMCLYCRTSMYPDEDGVYEFEGSWKKPLKSVNPSTSKASEENEDGVVDLLDMEISKDQEDEIKRSLMEKTKYKEVAPTWELNIETYGYGKKRKIYDPDYDHVEMAKFREYERLESTGYDSSIKDADHDKPKNFKTPGLGANELKEDEPKKELLTSSDYVVPPKVPQLVMGPGIGPVKPRSKKDSGDDDDEDQNILKAPAYELPPEMADLQKSPCVNVPEWFVKNGGELCLSDTKNGVSVIRYWPKFLSDKGNHLMFNRLRKYCKWHQKQVKIGGQWKYETRLVAWYGPCDYVYSGLNLDKNLNWAPELLDLLNRLVTMTNNDFNSCFANLYRHGHDMCGWHSDIHPQLGRNPTIASVSLGVVRCFEFRKKTGPANFIRFPLFPGSLLVMEGATQEDWLHCLPRDINCKEERMNLTFRTMYSIDKR